MEGSVERNEMEWTSKYKSTRLAERISEYQNSESEFRTRVRVKVEIGFGNGDVYA